MKKKTVSAYLLVLSLAFFYACNTYVDGTVSVIGETCVYVHPETTWTLVNTTFVIEVKIDNVLNLMGAECRMRYNTSKLHCLDIGTDHMPIEQTEPLGYIHFWDFYLDPIFGNVTLASIEFQCISLGESVLDLYSTKLSDPGANPIPHDVKHGYSINTYVTNVSLSKTVVGQGCPLSINVTVENQGSNAVSFNVTTYANSTEINSREVTLASGNSTTLTFTWNTTGIAKGKYIIAANMFIDGWVIVTIPGDVNGDYIVDIYDAILQANAFGSEPGADNWNPNADINSDEIVDIYDAIILAIHFGEEG